MVKQMISSTELKTGYRRAWLLTGFAAIFIVSMLLFVFLLIQSDQPDQWNMGGKSFVPASSEYGQGYYDSGDAKWEQPAEVPGK
jgi:hypothetical protein